MMERSFDLDFCSFYSFNITIYLLALAHDSDEGSHVENRSIGELSDLTKHISSLLSGTTHWSALTVEMINSDDAIQLSPDDNMVRIDCPLRSSSKSPLESPEAQIFESVDQAARLSDALGLGVIQQGQPACGAKADALVDRLCLAHSYQSGTFRPDLRASSNAYVSRYPASPCPL